MIEFLVAVKDTVGNIHKWFRVVYGSAAVDRSAASRWVKRVRNVEVGKFAAP